MAVDLDRLDALIDLLVEAVLRELERESAAARCRDQRSVAASSVNVDTLDAGEGKDKVRR